MPVTLVMGLATSALALKQLLPFAAVDMMQLRHFRLAPVHTRAACLCVQPLGDAVIGTLGWLVLKQAAPSALPP